MRFEEFLTPSAQMQGMMRDFRSGRTAHAYLLYGPAGTGKRTLARLCAQTLFCAATEKERVPCGVCAPCKRFLSGNHPDVIEVTSGEKKSIGVDEIRALRDALGERAYEEGSQAILIPAADTMTPQAQNALLKTLEEPPGRAVFFLTAETLSAMLPTICSRCRLVQCMPLRTADARKALEASGIAAERAQALAVLTGGCLGEALRMETDTDAWAFRKRVLTAAASVRTPGDVPEAASTLRDDKDRAGQALTCLTQAVRDMLHAKTTGEPYLSYEDGGLADGLAGCRAETLCTLLERLTRARKMLSSNVGWQVVLEGWLLTLAEERNA